MRARAYDLALNGSEIAGGSIRIHRADVQRHVFRLLGISDEEARARFGFFLDALEYGTPPHGGIAFGLDRIVALMCGEASIREVIAFPKTAQAVGLDVRRAVRRRCASTARVENPGHEGLRRQRVAALRLGIDLGGTKIAAVVLAPDGSVRWEQRMPTPRHDYDATLEAIAALVGEGERACGASCSIGIGMPGAISPATGLVKNANSTWLNGRAFKQDLERRLGARRCAWRTTPTASPCRKRPTAPRPARRWCSA